MRLPDALVYAFEQIRDRTVAIVEDLDAQALTWRPDPQANTIAWLAWHLARVADRHVAHIAGHEQVWIEQGWAARFGLPADYTDHGFRHTSEQVAQIAPSGAELVAYVRAALDAVIDSVGGLDDADFDRVIDPSYDPPVTVGVRLQSAIGDAWQHAGQAGYVRGLYERRAPARAVRVPTVEVWWPPTRTCAGSRRCSRRARSRSTARSPA